jgi:amylosucrase
MDWSRAGRRHDRHTLEGRIFQGLSHQIRVRRSTSLMHGFALFQPLWTGNDHVLGYSRKRPEGTVLVFANFTADDQAIDAEMARWGGLEGELANLLAPRRPLPFDRGSLWLVPYEVMWLTTVEDVVEAQACCG